MQFAVEHPLAYYGALSVAMSASLYLFVTVARDLESLKRKVDRNNGALEAKVATLSALRRPQATATGVDINQRTQVMRLARRGDRPEQIAAELRVPKNEVELLIKVQRAIVREF